MLFKGSIPKRKLPNDRPERAADIQRTAEEHSGAFDIDKERYSSCGTCNNGSQFYCKIPSCNKSFTRKADLQRHHKSLHDPYLIFCGCCENKSGTFSSSRMDKFQDHQRKVHGRSNDCRSDPFCFCPIPSCLEKSSCTKHSVCFGLQENLDHHMLQKHNRSDPAVRKYSFMHVRGGHGLITCRFSYFSSDLCISRRTGAL